MLSFHRTSGLLEVCLLLALVASAFSQTTRRPGSPASGSVLVITVVDENGVAVPSARVLLHTANGSSTVRCETDFTGHCYVRNTPAGDYLLDVQKQGFYALSGYAVNTSQVPGVDVRLTHLQEVHEVVNVVESPPGIDPQQTASTEQLTGMDVLNTPYPASHDYRNVLNYIPGVIQDNFGQPHINGAETSQSLTLLDGFNITQPANGQLLLRVSTDAIRSIHVESSRISSEYGKGSAGVLAINTGIGDDHFRFAATNFIPSFQFTKGLSFDSLVPRVTFSGPLRKGKIWFFEGWDGEYDHTIIREIEHGIDTDNFWRIGNMAKIQANLAPGNILTASYLLNRQTDEYLGLSIFTPAPSTPRNRESGDFLQVKDQIYFAGGELLEYGFNFDEYVSDFTPHNSGPSLVSSANNIGSFFLRSHTVARRWQGLANMSFAPEQWHGRHELKAGVDIDRVAYNPLFFRSPVSYLRIGANPSDLNPPSTTCLNAPTHPCSRYTIFRMGPQREVHNAQFSGYVQDRWAPTERLLLEGGVRFDWDEIIRDPLYSPRLAATYVPNNSGNTKFSAGAGIFYDETNIVLVSRPFEGQRTDYFWDGNGNPVVTGACAQPPPGTIPPPCPVPLSFSANQNGIRAPRFFNWSVAFEQRLPYEVYLKAEFIQRHGKDGLVYNTPPGSPVPSGNFFLQNTRKDHYDSLQISARKPFRQTYLVTLSYIRSRSRSNQVLDFNIDNPLYSPQVAGPYVWDAPNRILSTGIAPVSVPLLHKVDLEYSAEARDGFPFYVVNNRQELVTTQLVDNELGRYRFPFYFSLNLFLEKRFHLFGRYWAVRGGFIDITGRKNPALVNNDIDSPLFLSFGGLQHRAFTTRIRLLGKK
jgi:hypothetical protein